MIRFEQVSLRLPSARRQVIQDCSFTIRAGELVVILGPSGCGKTTLLKLVNRLYGATTGQIYLQDTEIRQLPVTALRRQIGYVIQQGGLFPHMTVAGNIAVVPRLLGWSKPKIQARVDALLDLMGLPAREYRDRYPAQLSGGQQQRVGLARALAADPPVMLMDEPFGALDAITRSDLQNQILSLQRQLQKTILFVSHDIEEALRLGDRLLILDRGQVIQLDTPLNILRRPANAFVAQLVGTEDIVRLLSLLRVESVMISHSEAVADPAWPEIEVGANLRQALGLLLSTGSSGLQVIQERSFQPQSEPERGVEARKCIGMITLERIQTICQHQDYQLDLHP